MTHLRTALMTTVSAVAFENGYTPTPEQIQMAKKKSERAYEDMLDPMVKRSPDSRAMMPYWDKVDAILDGIDGMRLARTDYLPKFADEADNEYNYRLQMTKMTNVFSDIVEGLASKPFEQHITMLNDEAEIPETVSKFIDDVDGSGNNLTVFGAGTFHNGIANAIDWIFVDYSEKKDNIKTRADAKRAGLRPYWSRVLARNVLQVTSKMINGVEMITYFKVLEPGDPDRIREFVLDENSGKVTWALYERQAEKLPQSDTFFVKIKSGDLSIGIIPMVPFITGPRDGRNWKVRPPMKQAADLQVELYQQESGLKFAKNLTAYPMLAANGIQPPTNEKGELQYKIAVGPNRVLWSKTDAQGKVGNWQYLEPGSESLKFLAEDIQATIRELRELGRQPLTAQSGNITVITAAVAASKAKSAVKQWALMLKDSLENALKITMMWLDETFEPEVHVFSEFDDFTEGEDLEALDNARERGDISRRTHWEELKRRGVLSSNFSAERENERLLEEVPGDDEIEPDDPDA